MNSLSIGCRLSLRTLRRRLPLAALIALPLLSLQRLDADPLISRHDELRNPALPWYYAPGSPVTLDCIETTLPVGGLQWLHNGTPIPGATGASLTLPAVSSTDAGSYQVTETAAGGTALSPIVQLHVQPLPTSPVDTSFTADLPVDRRAGESQMLGVAADDSLTVQVNFATPKPPEIIRLNADGSHANGFSLPLAQGSVLAALADGSVIVSQAPYRLSPDGVAANFVLPAGFDPTQPLTAAAAQPDGKILIAQARALARLNADGSVDPTFVYATSLNATIAPQSFTFDAAGHIYVLGDDQTTYPDHQQHSLVYRLLSNGTEDTGFARQIPRSGSYAYRLFPLVDGRILEREVGLGQAFVAWTLLKADGTVDPNWSAPAGFRALYAVVDPTALRLFAVNPLAQDYAIRRYTVTTTGLSEDADFYQGDGYCPGDSEASLRLTPDGHLLALNLLSTWDSHASADFFRLRSSDHVTVPPTAMIAVTDQTPSRDSAVTFSSQVHGTGPLTYQWLALDGQPLPAGGTSAQLAIANVVAANLGRYQLSVTGAGGTVVSNILTLTFDPHSPYLANLSGRAMTGAGEDTVIAGLTTSVAAGASGLPTLLRGAGPALAPFGVSGFLPNPAIELYDGSGQLIAHNDQWSDIPNVAAVATAVGAFPFTAGSNDAALLHTFSNGSATLMLQNQGAGTGTGLLEIYQVGPASADQSLVNLSFRANTAPGDATAIAGFVIVDPRGFGRSVRVLLRAVGPTLSTQGIQHPLANPILTVYDVHGNVVAQNDDWSVSPASNPTASADLAAAMKQVGAFVLPADSKDAALLLDLPAGAYTMHATGGSGVVLLEIYLVR